MQKKSADILSFRNSFITISKLIPIKTIEFPCESLNITFCKQDFVIKLVIESFDIALKRFVIMYNFGSTENLNKENVDIKCTI